MLAKENDILISYNLVNCMISACPTVQQIQFASVDVYFPNSLSAVRGIRSPAGHVAKALFDAWVAGNVIQGPGQQQGGCLVASY